MSVLPHLLALLCLPLQGQAEQAPAPPGQPSTGPGGAEYPHAAVTRTLLGQGARAYWLFEPDEPRPASAPLVVFLHGYGATDPRTYGAWIEHLVRRGKTVCYPRYQRGVIPRLDSFTPNAIRAVRAAIATLGEEGRVALEEERLAVVGHSIGGLLAANLAAAAEEEGLPVPAAVFTVLPGSAAAGAGELELFDMGRIPTGTLLLSMACDADTVSGVTDARRIYLEATEIPVADKDFLVMASDAHGRPALEANHLTPLAIDDRYGETSGRDDHPGEPRRQADALDYYGTWKLFDALCDAAFDGRHREHALGNTAEQRFMGLWSDGQPVQELNVTDFSLGLARPRPAD